MQIIKIKKLPEFVFGFFLFFTLLFCNAASAQTENTDGTFNNDSLVKLFSNYDFLGYYKGPVFPQEFVKRKSKNYGIPSDETIFAFVDASVLGNCKYGVAFGLKGLYINNSNTSSSGGTRFLSYANLRSHDLIRIDIYELTVGFTGIELRGLPLDYQKYFEDLIKQLKWKSL